MSGIPEKTRRLAEGQLARYPALAIQDLVKAVYQEEMGCGHLISDPREARSWLEEETARVRSDGETPLSEPLGDRFCRVHLAALRGSGLRVETLFRLFERSARERGDMERLKARIAALGELIRRGEIPLERESALNYLREYEEKGCPAVHHSEAFRAAYAPAYRVIRGEMGRLLPLLCAIDRLMEEKGKGLVAIEGGSASGKTTLGMLLGGIYGCNVFHMDDFFLQVHQRTPQRYAEPGGNVDRERFLEEVLKPLAKGGPFSYRVFDCVRMELGERVDVEPTPLNVVEGAYSMHPDLAGFYDLSVFLELDPVRQASRILRRNGAVKQKRFLEEWIPLEQRYFEGTDTKARCGMVLPAPEEEPAPSNG